MKKLILFAFIVLFTGFMNVKAKHLFCDYYNDNSEVKYSIEIDINKKDLSKSSVIKIIKKDSQTVSDKTNEYLVDVMDFYTPIYVTGDGCPETIIVDDNNNNIKTIFEYKNLSCSLKDNILSSLNFYYNPFTDTVALNGRNLIYKYSEEQKKITIDGEEISNSSINLNVSLSEQACPQTIYLVSNSILTEDISGVIYKSDWVDLSASAGCLNLSKTDCITSKEYACLWNETKYGNYCNVDDLLYVRCGDAKDIPYMVPGLISFGVNFLKILTPIILIVTSVISLLKALASSNEDVIKKAQKGLIRKIIAAVMVFMVITIVQFVIMKVADSEIESVNGQVETSNISDCLNCLLNNNCKETVYYKTYIGSELKETPVTQIPR